MTKFEISTITNELPEKLKSVRDANLSEKIITLPLGWELVTGIDQPYVKTLENNREIRVYLDPNFGSLTLFTEDNYAPNHTGLYNLRPEGINDMDNYTFQTVQLFLSSLAQSLEIYYK